MKLAAPLPPVVVEELRSIVSVIYCRNPVSHYAFTAGYTESVVNKILAAHDAAVAADAERVKENGMKCSHENYGLHDGTCVDCGEVSPHLVTRLRARLERVVAYADAHEHWKLGTCSVREVLRLARGEEER